MNLKMAHKMNMLKELKVGQKAIQIERKIKEMG